MQHLLKVFNADQAVQSYIMVNYIRTLPFRPSECRIPLALQGIKELYIRKL
jgi:hypothetical protein